MSRGVLKPEDEAYRQMAQAGSAHLSHCCPVFSRVIAAIGPCTLVPQPDLFPVLVRSIVAQLISTAAARTISARLEAKVKGRLTPSRVAKLSPDEIRSCGLSNAKAGAIHGLAGRFAKDRKLANRIREADDATARHLLLEFPGVGPWTVDMMLIFSLGRPDILPVGDLGLRAGVRDLFGLAELPTAPELTRLAEPWRPFRSVATWYVWRGRGAVPQSETPVVNS